jgi:hypothetical protein
MSNVASIEDRVVEANVRPVYELTLPEELQGQDEYIKHSVGLVKLRAEEQARAYDSAGTSIGRMASALAKACLKEIDGRPLDFSKGEDQQVWNRMLPEIRDLISSAYTHLNNAKENHTKDFLASMVIKG